MKGLKIVCPSSVSDPSGLRKLEHYYGIEFTRGASNGGGDNGYHRMIGDASLLKEMRFHNQMKIAAVKDAETTAILNQVNWNKLEGGAASVLDGSDGSDIMQLHTKDVYAIIGGTNPTYERFIVSDQPFSYDGDEAKFYPAYGETPDYATLKDGKMRSIRNESVAGTHASGSGTAHSNTNYGTPDASGYPRTSLSRYQFEQYARAKNPDSGANLPYMNICNQDLELTQAFMFIEFRTKCLTNLLGHGMSANSFPSAANWGKVTGFRLTTDGGQTYTYASMGSQFYIGANTFASNMWTILNGSCPLLKMFEAQLAVSNGANIEAVNDSDGNPVAGVSDGVMTGIWTKSFSFKFTAATTAGGEKKEYSAECVLRVPIWRGRTRLWGNCTQWYSGYEFVQWLEGTTLHHKLYRSPSVEALVSDTNETIYDSEGHLGFERSYDFVGNMPTVAQAGSGIWATKTFSLNGITLPIPEVGGGAISTYEQSHFWASAVDLKEGQYRRRGVRFGGNAYGAPCVLRYASGSGAPSNASPYVGSGFRVTLND